MDKHTALLIIDMINPLSFEHGADIYPQTREIAENIFALKNMMKQKGCPILYVNDNYGKWKSDFNQLVYDIKTSNELGSSIAARLEPSEDDYSIIKPKFSGFFDTPLHLLLEHLNVRTLVLTGIVGNMCVQFTANDAYTLEYELCIPADGIASFTQKDTDVALHHFENILKADTRLCQEWITN
ncbi:cysteine hydrolase [Alkalihalobacillus sp. LMS6]|uniref:cysteine hydrolase family protein n=1 Tax=Alkalihalobacillus sp. LMS6 TaxID=2924034 RepID=UPI0020D1F24E|nr:isochorismatase family cysteine hydrolase [Alkalihalobacillus sp. LMS6]UTR05480.1 cysteine hydrolase [Alkalihalobacillus sp. LMS6]